MFNLERRPFRSNSQFSVVTLELVVDLYDSAKVQSVSEEYSILRSISDTGTPSRCACRIDAPNSLAALRARLAHRDYGRSQSHPEGSNAAHLTFTPCSRFTEDTESGRPTARSNAG
jgi:hypothetical protein